MKSPTVCFLLLVILPRHSLENELKNDCPADWTSSICSCKDSQLISCERANDGKQIENVFRYTGNNNRFKVLNLLYSNVTKLPDGVFGKLSFESFNLVDNNLNTISRFAFKGSEETAKVIWLERNNLSPAFDLKFLFPLRQLNSINIVESNLQTIATGAFGNLPNLEKINIQNNNLKKLGKFAFSLLPKLTVIDLSENKLPKLEKNMFNTSHAQYPILVDLSRNEIQDIETDAFADLKTNSVSLAYNKLTTLNQDAFEPLLDSMKLIKNSELQIEGNPITCDSRLDWLHDKPLAYRQQVKGLTCGEFTNEPETVPTPKSPERPKNCIYSTHSDQVHAFFHGHQLINRSPIPHLGVIKFRCSNVQNLKFVGKHVIQCLNGKFSDSMPDCVGLVPNSRHCIVTEIDHGFFVPAAVSDYARYNMIPTSALLPHDTKAQIACDEHYEMPSHEPVAQNHGDVQCNNGTWAPTNVCVPSRCFCDDLKYDQLHERNLTLARDCVEPTAHNQEVPLKCEPEFPEMVKKGVLKCKVGEWKYPQDPDERCTKKSCTVQDIKLDNGKIYEDGEDWQLPAMDDPKVVPHGTELKFECTEEGYELYVGKNAVNPPSSKVNFTRECENGIWSARMPVCKPARCLCSNLTANLTDKGLETAECEELASSGDLVQLNCAANYSNPTGPLIAVCQFGEWKPMNTECQKICSCDELRSGLDPSLQVKCADYIGSGTVLHVDCNKGYVNMTGTPDVECVIGEWMINETFCNATEDVPTAAPKDCKYHSESNPVQAFHQGKFLFNDSPVPHLGNVTLRCSNIQNLKFIGKRVLQCVDGKFNDAMPQCVGLIPDSPLSAPPLWLTTYPPEFHKTTEDGIVVVPRGSAVSITCWWSQSNPDVTVTGDVKPKSHKHATFNKISGYTTAFDAINEVTNIDYSCGIPGSEKGGKLTQFLKLKIADTCRMVENKVQQYGLLIDNQTRRYLYVEEDRVDLICGDLVKKGIQYMTCKRNGKWEWGPEEDCPEKTTEVPTTEATS